MRHGIIMAWIAARLRGGRAAAVAGNGKAGGGDAPECVRREGAVFRAGNAGQLALDPDGWLDVAWPGEFPHPDGFVQAVEPADIQLALANFRSVAAASGDAWGGVPLYIGHPELNGTAAEAPSFGWFKAARVANGALQYQLEPTAEGGALIAGRKYKFISPYWYGTFDAAGSFHPHFVSSVGLTNNPVIRAHQGNRPLANADAGESAAEGAADAASPDGAASAAAAAPQDAPWWAAFTGDLATMIAGAQDAESARRILSGKLNALYAEVETLRQLRGLIERLFGVDGMVCPESFPSLPAFDVTLTEAVQGLRAIASANAGALARLAETFGAQPDEGEAIDVEALVGAANAARTGAAERDALRAQFAGFVVDQAIARGCVLANARAEALRIATPNLGDAMSLWFGGSAVRPAESATVRPRTPPAAVARAAANAAAGAGRGATPPADPLSGKRLANAGAGALTAGPEVQAVVLEAAKRHQGESGCGWSAANAWAWDQWHNGLLATQAGGER